jgi:ubiquinone/menaquinone biosynthesis C-methylase UbiE
MVHRTLPLFKGKDIESILKNSYRWLKAGGRLYIVAMSKDHIAFRDKIKYKSSKRWPGEDLVVVKKHLPDQAYALPKRLHVMSIDTLVKELEKLGFQVERVGEVSLKNVGTETNRDGKEAVGLIAIKN